MKTTLLFWLICFVPVALMLAVFEIHLDEKYKAGRWGKTEFINPYWEEKVRLPLPFIKYISRYHVVIFLEVLPVLFSASMFFWSMVSDYRVVPEEPSRLSSTLSIAMLFAAIWLGNSGFEDFFYFAIQSLTGWHEPHALRKVLIEKDFGWFKDWLPPFFGINIPGHWVACPAGALVLLYVRQRLLFQ